MRGRTAEEEVARAAGRGCLVLLAVVRGFGSDGLDDDFVMACGSAAAGAAADALGATERAGTGGMERRTQGRSIAVVHNCLCCILLLLYCLCLSFFLSLSMRFSCRRVVDHRVSIRTMSNKSNEDREGISHKIQHKNNRGIFSMLILQFSCSYCHCFLFCFVRPISCGRARAFTKRMAGRGMRVRERE